MYAVEKQQGTGWVAFETALAAWVNLVETAAVMWLESHGSATNRNCWINKISCLKDIANIQYGFI